MFDNADLKYSNIKDSKGNSHKLDHAIYSRHLKSFDRVLRERAFKNIIKATSHIKTQFQAHTLLPLKKIAV